MALRYGSIIVLSEIGTFILINMKVFDRDTDERRNLSEEETLRRVNMDNIFNKAIGQDAAKNLAAKLQQCEKFKFR